MRARRLGALLALAAVALLVVAEFRPLFEVTVAPSDVVKRSVGGGRSHGYALLIIAIAAVLLSLPALRGARPAALALVALGAGVLAVALVIDLPDTRGAGTLPESLAYESVQARAGVGFTLEIVGGVLLVVAGGVLAVAGGGVRGAGGGDSGRGGGDSGRDGGDSGRGGGGSGHGGGGSGRGDGGGRSPTASMTEEG